MKINKIIAGIMAVCVMGFGIPYISTVADNTAITASAEDYTEGTYKLLTYLNYGDYIEISRCDEYATEIVIPSEIDGVPVTSIRYNAFCYCSDLTSIVIPESVTSIGERAFFCCTGLTSVEIPDSVTNIEVGAFYDCTDLTSIVIPDSLTSIGGQAFHGTSWLEEKRKENPFVIVNGILIDGYACSGDVIIPDYVTSIGNDAFRDCSALTSISIPNNVTNIENGAFWNCTGLTSIVIPDSVTSIGNSVFGNCTSLTSIEIPDRVNTIGENTFYYCSSLTSIEIPDSVTSIGWMAFYKCENLTSITILNPDCNIYNDSGTFSNLSGFDGTIYGYDNSTAQTYAEKYNRNFVSLGKVPEKETALGDVNGDELIDAIDATAIFVEYAQLSTGGASTFSYAQTKSADVNSDGQINAVDATIILQYYAHLSTGGTDPIDKFI